MGLKCYILLQPWGRAHGMSVEEDETAGLCPKVS